MERINRQDNSRDYYQNTAANDKAQDKSDINNNQKDKDKESIYAGDLKFGQNDLLAKKDQTKENALKVILDAFAGEQKIDEKVEEHLDKAKDLTKEANEASGEMNRLGKLKQDLKETYGIADDSEEQKDLELLEKKKDVYQDPSKGSLTAEEEERINNMGPLTEYQQAALEYHDMELIWNKRLDNANDKITVENQIAESIQLGRVKIHPIVDAKKEAQDILDTASREFVGGLVEEAKDKIDDEIGDDSDTADEIKDKEKKEQEEAAKAASKKDDDKKAEKPKDVTVPTSQIVDQEIDWEKVQRDVKAAADKANLLMEDLKGITVDEQV